MKKCPKCGSGAERKNRAEGIAAGAVGYLAGFAAGIFGGAPLGNQVRKNVSESICDSKDYKCTNPQCGHEWSDTNDW